MSSLKLAHFLLHLQSERMHCYVRYDIALVHIHTKQTFFELLPRSDFMITAGIRIIQCFEEKRIKQANNWVAQILHGQRAH